MRAGAVRGGEGAGRTPRPDSSGQASHAVVRTPGERTDAVSLTPVDEPEVVQVGTSLPRAGMIVAAAMAFGNGLNYLYQVVMSRQLGKPSFGALGALLALSFIM